MNLFTFTNFIKRYSKIRFQIFYFDFFNKQLKQLKIKSFFLIFELKLINNYILNEQFFRAFVSSIDAEEATVEDVKPDEEVEEEKPTPAHKRHHHHHKHHHHKHHHHHHHNDEDVCTDRQNCPAPAADHNKFTVSTHPTPNAQIV